jgi:hypothetical protein
MEDILLIKDVDLSKVTFGDLQTMGTQGGKLVPINYNFNNKFIIQTPECRTPFGINKWENDGTGPVKYSINLSFGKSDTRSAEQEIMFKLFSALDDLIVKTAYENCVKWFSKKHPNIDVVKALYTPMVKYPIDKATLDITDKYGPTLKLNLPYKDNKFQIDCYNNNAELIQNILEFRTKGAIVQGIVQLGSVWCVGGKFGCAPRVVQLQITPPASIQGFAFKSNPSGKLSDDKEYESDGEDIAVDIDGDDKKILADSSDDDDDDDDDEGVVELPPQVSVSKKSVKTVKK